VSAGPSKSTDPNADAGGIRLLIIDRDSQTGNISLSRENFEALEQVFHLSITTLPILDCSTGICSSFKDFDSKTGLANRFSILLDAPACPIGGPHSFSQTYDFTTKWSTVLMVWTDFSEGPETHAVDLANLFALNHHLWSRATLMPVLMLQLYMHFYESEFSDNMNRLWTLEDDVGVTRVRTDTETGSESLDNWPSTINVKELTATAHSIAADLIIIAEACDWAHRSLEALLQFDLDPERQGIMEERLAPGIQTTRMLVQETVDLTENIDRSTKLLQLRVQIQANAVSERPFPCSPTLT
jgi:hypothetical protein